MYSEFLKHEKTFAACDKNLHTWHQGIPWYGFWAVLISQEDWLESLQSAREYLQEFLLPGYTRQAHITISASGLLSEQHFSQKDYQQQKQRLLQTKPKEFYLHSAHLNSFLSAPYLSIEDPQNQLLKLRSLLGNIKADDEPAVYHPHITLGLYRDSFPSQQITQKLKAFKLPELSVLRVKEIVYCRYRTDKLQDAFEPQEIFPLAAE